MGAEGNLSASDTQGDSEEKPDFVGRGRAKNEGKNAIPVSECDIVLGGRGCLNFRNHFGEKFVPCHVVVVWKKVGGSRTSSG